MVSGTVIRLGSFKVTYFNNAYVFLFIALIAPNVACIVGFSNTCDILMQHGGFLEKCFSFYYSSRNIVA